jgi:hypothetical protein
MPIRDAKVGEEGSHLVRALETLGRTLSGEGTFDRDAARRALDEVRHILHATGTTDSTADTNVKEAGAVIEQEDELGSVDVLRRRENVGRKLLSWAEALHTGARSEGFSEGSPS